MERYPYVLDLFSGAGGFSLGAHLAGFSTAVAIELDGDLSASYRDNFPNAKLIRADITTLDPIGVLRHAGFLPADVRGILGGPPCQGYSIIGKRDPNDHRNLLVSDFFRFVAAIRPAFFVLENVPGILDYPFRRILDAGIDSVGGCYEIVGPMEIDAADFGAATRRVRAIVIGYRRDEVDQLTEADIRRGFLPASSVRDAISDLPPPEAAEPDERGDWWARYPQLPDSRISAYARRARQAPPPGLGSTRVRAMHAQGKVSGFHPTAHTPEVRERFSRLAPGRRDDVSKATRLDWDVPAPTIRAGTGKDRGSFQAVRPIHPEEPRVITPREAARLQGFPDWFMFHPTRWHSFRMIGNSVSPYLAEAILRLLASRLGVCAAVRADHAPLDHGKYSANTG